ncbi:F0F1 ATP synthase subunit delta [Arenimonas fontis]|uniref:ATP synthase subunit delta n=1 Tax=Arenimonas fontis TaxID=2608255 RepID=A0A5B2Z7P7_9GAMM|nr:F0F1 ATP synthase subunit delta [Arenimonas fontis]KAA2283270.1 F0F1 ATP synthase subunit delta [Arenimonas fontis]
MSQALTLARPYARAAFALAKDTGRLPRWSALLGFAAQAASVPEAQAAIGHPLAATADLVELLTPPGDADPEFRQFLAVLAENRRLALLPEIAGLYEQLRAEAERVVKARVTSARPLAADELEKLRASLRNRFGREIDLATAVDESLIGGAVIDAGDVVIDGSLRTKLARLGAALAN